MSSSPSKRGVELRSQQILGCGGREEEEGAPPPPPLLLLLLLLLLLSLPPAAAAEDDDEAEETTPQAGNPPRGEWLHRSITGSRAGTISFPEEEEGAANALETIWERAQSRS